MNIMIHKPQFWRANWSLMAGIGGAVIFSLLSPIASTEWHSWREMRAAQQEQSTPVVSAAWTVVARDENFLSIDVKGEKLRDCRIVGIQAFSVDSAGFMGIANIERVGFPTFELTQRPIGPFHMGILRVWPVGPDATSVVIYVMHSCRNGEVRSLLAKVDFNAADSQ